MLAVILIIEARQILARDAREHAVERFQEHDLLARLGQHGRPLEPDIAAADHHDLLRGFRGGLHRIRVGTRAPPPHAGHAAPPPRPPSGRETVSPYLYTPVVPLSFKHTHP